MEDEEEESEEEGKKEGEEECEKATKLQYPNVCFPSRSLLSTVSLYTVHQYIRVSNSLSVNSTRIMVDTFTLNAYKNRHLKI